MQRKVIRPLCVFQHHHPVAQKRQAGLFLLEISISKNTIRLLEAIPTVPMVNLHALAGRMMIWASYTLMTTKTIVVCDKAHTI